MEALLVLLHFLADQIVSGLLLNSGEHSKWEVLISQANILQFYQKKIN